MNCKLKIQTIVYVLIIGGTIQLVSPSKGFTQEQGSIGYFPLVEALGIYGLEVGMISSRIFSIDISNRVLFPSSVSFSAEGNITPGEFVRCWEDDPYPVYGELYVELRPPQGGPWVAHSPFIPDGHIPPCPFIELNDEWGTPWFLAIGPVEVLVAYTVTYLLIECPISMPMVELNMFNLVVEGLVPADKETWGGVKAMYR